MHYINDDSSHVMNTSGSLLPKYFWAVQCTQLTISNRCTFQLPYFYGQMVHLVDCTPELFLLMYPSSPPKKSLAVQCTQN